MAMRFTFAWATAIFLTLSVSGSLTATEAAWTPRTNRAVTWEGLAWEFGVWGQLLTTRIDPEGYSCESFVDRVKDDDPGRCTRQVWDRLSANVGIFYGCGHGDFGEFAVVAFKTHDRADHYIEAGNGPQGWDVWDSRREGVSRCWVSDQWLRTNWRPNCDANRSIMWWGACYSAEGSARRSSIMQAAGGREAFGYIRKTKMKHDRQDIPAVFDRMNGRVAVGTMRRSAQAFGGPGNGSSLGGTWVTRRLRRLGNGNTTLCPSVEHPAADDQDAVYPVGEGAPSSGTGYVILDTHCLTFTNTSKSVESSAPTNKSIIFRRNFPLIEDFLSFSISALPDADGFDITNVWWESDSEIRFVWSADCYITEFTVECVLWAPLVRALEAEGSDTYVPALELDGGVLTKHGVAPNGDKFSWSFGR